METRRVYLSDTEWYPVLIYEEPWGDDDSWFADQNMDVPVHLLEAYDIAKTNFLVAEKALVDFRNSVWEERKKK